MRKIFNRGNVLNAIFVALILVVVFVPAAKAFMLRGLMEIGLFKPNTAKLPEQTTVTAGLSGVRFKNVTGETLDLGELKGKVVFLNFWATWCPPCRAEMPAVNKLYNQFKDDKDVVFILVDADSDFKKAQQYMDGKGYKLPVYAVDSDVPEQLFAGSLPTTVVLDKQGRISYHEVGAADYANPKFVDFIKKLKGN